MEPKMKPIRPPHFQAIVSFQLSALDLLRPLFAVNPFRSTFFLVGACNEQQKSAFVFNDRR